MKAIVKGEREFFWFQDGVEIFLKTLQNPRRFPLVDKIDNRPDSIHSASRFIADSWLDVFSSLLLASPKTELNKRLCTCFEPWMITTNLAIIKAQQGRGSRHIPERELEYAEKYSPYFVIDLSEDYEEYRVSLEGPYEEVFLEAVNFFKILSNLNPSSLQEWILRFFEVEEKEIQESLMEVSRRLSISSLGKSFLESYVKEVG